jgi:hypothetical protein
MPLTTQDEVLFATRSMKTAEWNVMLLGTGRTHKNIVTHANF